MTTRRLYIEWFPALAMATVAWLTPIGRAQDAIPPVPSPAEAGVSRTPSLSSHGYPSYVKPQSHYQHKRRSVVHHYPYPYPAYYHGDQTAGFRNPGGVGRYAEYYPAGDHFQVENDPVRPAQFAQGGGAPDRAEQIAAYNAGTQRYNAIQRHIDSYARPYYGYGFGVGGFGGFW